MRNCLVNRLGPVLGGEVFLYRGNVNGQRAIVEVVRTSAGNYRLGEHLGRLNRPLGEGDTAALKRWTAGLRSAAAS